MNLPLALERNHNALFAILTALGEMLCAGISGTGRITKLLRNAILRILAPAESAVRRLIVVAARGMKEPAITTSWWSWYGPRSGQRRHPAERLAFPLFDKPKHHRLKPRKPENPLAAQPAAATPPPAGPAVDARRLFMRFEALRCAYNDLPGEARRLVFLMARRKKSATGKPASISPLRSGDAPGHRKKRTHPVDEILEECQVFAKAALSDTS